MSFSNLTMKVPPHILRLYARTAKKYRKIFAKIHRESITAYQRKTFLQKLRKLVRTLRQLESQLKIAAATGGLLLALNTNHALAQTQEPHQGLGPFVKQLRTNNLLREPILTHMEPNITVLDYDK